MTEDKSPGWARHPQTGRLVRVAWIRDYFGPDQYGVRFEGEEYVHHETGFHMPYTLRQVRTDRLNAKKQ